MGPITFVANGSISGGGVRRSDFTRLGPFVFCISYYSYERMYVALTRTRPAPLLCCSACVRGGKEAIDCRVP